MKDPNKKKAAGTEKSNAPKKASEAKVIRLDDLIAPPGVRGGRKTFFGGK